MKLFPLLSPVVSGRRLLGGLAVGFVCLAPSIFARPPDTKPPIVKLTSPSAQTLAGSVTVSATAVDLGGSGLAGVQFQLDGANLGDEDTHAPFNLTWDTTLAPNGDHVVTAVARDNAGNSATSSPVNVSIVNTLPNGWTSSDIGNAGAEGSTNYSNGTYIIDGAGLNIAGVIDQFQFARVSASGDLTIVARVATQENTSRWAKAGIMIRESTDQRAKYVMLYVTPDNELVFEARPSTPPWLAVRVASLASAGAPKWLRLTRTGDTFHAAYSDNGFSWVTTGLTATTVDVAMGSDVLAGLAVSSGKYNSVGTATFDGVGVQDTGDYKVAFPKLGGVNYGAKNYQDAAYQEKLARLDYVLLGFYRGWAHPNIRTAVQQIKARNPNMLIGQYTIQESEYLTNDTNSAEYDINVKLNSGVGPNGIGDWWAYDAAGNRSFESSAQPETNITAFTQPDSDGLRFPQWLAWRSFTAYFEPVPEFDVWFVDNVFYRPRKNADWNRDGVNDSKDDPAVRTYYRQGNVDHVQAINQIRPGELIAANIDGWSPGDGFLREAQYQGLFSGALQEHAMGQNYSEESVANGWNQMMTSYRSLMDHTIAPHLVIFSADGAATDYAKFRYAFASALMEDGYFCYSLVNSSNRVTYSDVAWFDEYDLAGTSNTSWLGAAVDGPQRTARVDGVYVRRFEHGLAIVNPKGNGAKDIDLAALFPGETYKHVLGTQDPINDGSTVTTLSLPDRSGMILVKVE